MSDKVELARLLARKKAIFLARDDLIEFARLHDAVPDTPDDVSVSLYRPAKHHRVLGAALEEVEKGVYQAPPDHPAAPTRQDQARLAPVCRLGSSAETRKSRSLSRPTARNSLGTTVGRCATSSRALFYARFSPNVRLKAGSASMDRLETEQGGVLFFLGRGSGATGRGADVILLDDPTKDRKEADSPTIREQTLEVVHPSAPDAADDQGRGHRDHPDTLARRRLGRTADRPARTPATRESEAKKWRVIDMPAIARDNDVLGRKEGEALWPERFDREYLDSLRETDIRGFQALYQGRPDARRGQLLQGRVAAHLRPDARHAAAKSKLRFYARVRSRRRLSSRAATRPA